MYDPTYPPQNADIESAPLRAQFNGLKDIIDALNLILSAQVDAVNTINHNEPATATVNLVGNTLHFSFDIPRGGVGAPGPPFANAVIDAVNTLNAGESATVSVSFDGSNVRFTFGIPRGNDGGQGQQGEPGQPGEVTLSQLSNAINGTSNNTNGISTLDAGFADPDMEALRQKVNEMILNERR